MALETMKIRLKGVCPLLMHNVRLAHPFGEHALELKKISAKRKKTKDDHVNMAYIEFMGGLYMSGKKYILPDKMIEAVVRDGAKKQRKGKDAQCGVFSDDFILTKFDGPKKPESRVNEESCVSSEMVCLQGSTKILRTRPKFCNWEADGTIQFQPSIVDGSSVIEWLETAGEQVGVGDWRPKFGRFEVEIIK
jgi:hypothetical protein